MQTDTMRLRELTVRYTVKKDDEGRSILVGRTLSKPCESAAVLVPILQHEPVEVFAIVCLSAKHRVLAYHEVSRGTLDSTTVHPRDVFRAAILTNARCLVLAHVHPSGDPTPSPEDYEVTRRLVAAGVLLGIDVLDHIIVGDGRYVSLKELGCL